MTDEELTRRKETILALMNDPMYLPMKIKEIAIFLDIPKTQRPELQEVLDALLEEGKIRISAKGKYGKPEKQLMSGIFCANLRGFGFVKVEGLQQDIFIPEEKTGGAMQGDTVRISVDEKRGDRHAEGRVMEILSHANEQVIGFYRKTKNYGIVLPDNQKITQDIFIPEGKSMGAVTGHKVIVHITDFDNKQRHQPEGEVTEIIGHINDPGVDILSIVKAYDLPETFPEDVIREAEQIPSAVPEEKKNGRKDLRELQTVTIDGEDAKDLDDAVSLTRSEDGIWHLGVHIADVSAYVKENHPLDREALNRSTSVYLVDRVIPMLPHRLCNGICSLNEGEDRLALSCLMDIDEKGSLIGHEICESVIRSDRRMTYTAVNEIITNRDPETCDRYAEFVPMFLNMKTLADLIRKKRSERGYIDFDFPESRIILDEKGNPIAIKAYERNAATRLIEDFMLAANETVAEDYFWQQTPFLYRVHDNPDPEKMQALATFIHNFGYTIHAKNGDVHPKEIQKLLMKIEGTDAENLISRIALRSMKQARYSTECTGHFGLAAKYYCHFTSPIRRYPDLQIHRIIKENLHGELKEKRVQHYADILTGVAERTSALERRADDAERETLKYKKCQYMENHIGEVFEGVISGVTAFGLYVELPNTVEGLIRISDLKDDYYEFSEKTFELIGTMKNRHYRLGEKIWVEAVHSDKLARTIDFAMSERPASMTPEEEQEERSLAPKPEKTERKRGGKKVYYFKDSKKDNPGTGRSETGTCESGENRQWKKQKKA